MVYTVGLNEYEPTIQTSALQACHRPGGDILYQDREWQAGLVLYTLTGTGSGSGWTVSYYDMTYESYISAFDMTNGYEIDELTPGQTKEIRMEISHNGTPPGGVSYYHYIRARAKLESTEADTVRTATETPNYQPDNLVALPAGYIYEGNGISNTSGSGQSDTILNITALSTVSYLVK